MSIASTCFLCDSQLPVSSMLDGEKAFCCTGCHAVYNILSAKGGIENYREDPIFQQAVNFGLISNPYLIEELAQKKVEIAAEDLRHLHIEVGEMWCPSCSELIKLILLQERGVKGCVIDYATDFASIEYSPLYISKEKIFQIIEGLGYQPKPLQNQEKAIYHSPLFLRFIIALFCALNLMMFSYPLYIEYLTGELSESATFFSRLSLLFSLPVIGYSAWPIFRRFFTSLRVGYFGMETLVVMGVSTAFLLSLYELNRGSAHIYFDSMAMVIVFVLLGKIIETKAKFSARDSLLRLSLSLPRRGRVIDEQGKTEFRPLKEIKVGDSLLALTGERIVLDGIVLEGEGSCDEALMTGEALPLLKKKGSDLLGGSILKSGRLIYKATVNEEESALKKIIQMVEKRIGKKRVYLRAADSIVRWFVPFVVLLASLVAIFLWVAGVSDPGKSLAETVLLRFITILLISCPCAIGIAAPLVESLLLNSFANLGVIVRNRAVLPLLGREDLLVFDKTGTVTEGKFYLLAGFNKLTSSEKKILNGITRESIHPIALAISEKLALVEPSKMERVEEVIGRGIRAQFCGESYLLGSRKFMEEGGVILEEVEEKKKGSTYLYFSRGKKLLAELVLGDTLRKGMKEMITSLSSVERVLLSGDGQEAVSLVAQECGFDRYRASCSPLQKQQFIQEEKEKGKTIVMFGDGINDAPALTNADVAVSVVSASDISVQVSDIMFTTDRVELFSKVRKLSLLGQNIIKQNLFWTFFYNVCGMGLAIFGKLSPLFAAVAMVFSSLIVIFNALRIKRLS